MDEWCLSERIGEVALGEIQWLSSKRNTAQECEQDKDKESMRIYRFQDANKLVTDSTIDPQRNGTPYRSSGQPDATELAILKFHSDIR